MITVIVPAYNEEEAISGVLEKLEDVMSGLGERYEIIVVDDGSTDGTGMIAKSIASSYDRLRKRGKRSSRVRVVQHPVNRGYGSSIKTGLLAAKGERIVITDADGTYPVEAIPKLLGYGEYDMVVGSRTGDSVKVPLGRRPAKFLLSKLANYLSGFKIPDLNSGLRVFRKDLAMRYFHLYPCGFSFTITITLAFLSDGLSVKYVPINYSARRGESKMRRREFGSFSALVVRMVMYFKPLKVFMPFAVGLFILGVAFLLYNILFRFNISDLSVMLILASLQIGFIGLLADLVVKKTRV